MFRAHGQGQAYRHRQSPAGPSPLQGTRVTGHACPLRLPTLAAKQPLSEVLPFPHYAKSKTKPQ